LIGIGLTAGQAMGAVVSYISFWGFIAICWRWWHHQVVGMVISSCNAYLNGTPGAKHHLGYGMLARSTFGLWGSYFVVMLNVFQSFVFYGTQMYFGGQAFVIILNSLSPSFLHMRNTLPER
jgi:NCS1 family nucleobase:cation symporter-1